MDYEIKQIVPLTPVVIRYTEDGNEREDLFFFSPADQTLIPGFGEGEGPQDVENFGKSFHERLVDDLKKAEDASKIAVPQEGLILPK